MEYGIMKVNLTCPIYLKILIDPSDYFISNLLFISVFNIFHFIKYIIVSLHSKFPIYSIFLSQMIKIVILDHHKENDAYWLTTPIKTK